MSNQHKDPSVRVIVDSLEDNKAEKISIISLKGKAEFAEFMVVASGRSNKHVDSVSEKVFREILKEQDEIEGAGRVLTLKYVSLKHFASDDKIFR